MKISSFQILILSILSVVSTVLGNSEFNINIIPIIPFLCETSEEKIYVDLKIERYKNIDSWVDFLNKYVSEKGVIKKGLTVGERNDVIRELHLIPSDTVTNDEWDCKKIADKFSKNKEFIVKYLDIKGDFSGMENLYKKIYAITQQGEDVTNRMLNSASKKINVDSFKQAMADAHEVRINDWLKYIRKGIKKNNKIKDPYYRKALKDISACFKESEDNRVIKRADEYEAFLDKYKDNYNNGHPSEGKLKITSIEVRFDSTVHGLIISPETGHTKLLKVGNDMHKTISSCRV